jgi:hypothetical protein
LRGAHIETRTDTPICQALIDLLSRCQTLSYLEIKLDPDAGFIIGPQPNALYNFLAPPLPNLKTLKVKSRDRRSILAPTTLENLIKASSSTLQHITTPLFESAASDIWKSATELRALETTLTTFNSLHRSARERLVSLSLRCYGGSTISLDLLTQISNLTSLTLIYPKLVEPHGATILKLVATFLRRLRHLSLTLHWSVLKFVLV